MTECTYSSCSIVFIAGLAGLHQGASYWNATLSKWPRIALMTGSWSPRAWTRPLLLFPQLDEERALLRYQQLRLEMRERDGRCF